ncbi:hypothetical protein CsSME_00035969 [Camellia sinensis var. sinensis]|uniref:Uncharacterized protein n=1 Tax=Camellia sinensis var. sinensis TaxID=542762 RepID=A0A4S4DKU1_CAMSN|nr:30S ribosomal protein S9, chloroplastic-like [Camellia sinensis]THG03531.1 hypothetical protein TEA_009757 [Camellia sinensis var. sinensis]
MAISMSTLTSSFASLSFSSQISQNPHSLSFPRSKPPRVVVATPRLAVVASAVAAPSAVDLETTNLKKYVKSRLPGGFAAQTIFGTGRRKCAIARVVLQEGTGKLIINYRDAKVPLTLPLVF